MLAGLGAQLRRVDEPVAAHPDAVIRGWKVGDDVPPQVVRDHHLGIFGGKLVGLGNHPDPGFRPVRARHHAADIVVVNGDHGLCRGLSAQLDRRTGQQSEHADRRHTQVKSLLNCHRFLSVTSPAVATILKMYRRWFHSLVPFEQLWSAVAARRSPQLATFQPAFGSSMRPSRSLFQRHNLSLAIPTVAGPPKPCTRKNIDHFKSTGACAKNLHAAVTADEPAPMQWAALVS